MRDYPGGYDSLTLRELLDSVVTSHISKAVSPEKMSNAERINDLAFVKNTLVMAAHFIRSSIEEAEGEYLVGNATAEQFKRVEASGE